MPTLYVFRHGQTDFNRDKVHCGHLDGKLTKQGIKQAKYLGKLLKKIKFDLAFQSRLSRSVDTLKYVLVGHKEKIKIITDDRIIERDYGDFSGQKHADLIAKLGQEKWNQYRRGFFTVPPNGESFADVKIRVSDFIKDLITTYGGQDINIAISAHGNSIRLIRHILENTTTDEAETWSIPYDKFFKYKI